MDLLERACALAACPLLQNLAPAVLIRLAERARTSELGAGERRTTEDTVWVVARGTLAVVVREGGRDHAASVGGDRDHAASIGGDRGLTASLVHRRGAPAIAGNALGLIRVVRPTTPVVEVIAQTPSVLVGVGFDDVRDVFEEDSSALAALAAQLADLLLGDAT